MADYGTGAGALTGGTKTSALGTIAQFAVPLILSLFGSKKASPQAAAQTTQQQNALAINSLPPEIKALLNIQTQNAQAAQPLYLNALNATNALLPTWARGGGAPMAPGVSGSTQRPDATYAPNTSAGDAFGGGNKTPNLSNPDSPFSGAAVDNGKVPGNSLDPQTVMTIMALLGNPAAGALKPFIRKPVTSDTNFTLT